MKGIAAVGGFFFAAVLVGLFNHTVVAAEDGCRDIYLIAARGSGQEIKKSGEVNRFFNEVEGRITNQTLVSVARYELGTGWSEYSDKDSLYPAVGIYGWGSNMVGLGAKASGGDSFLYGLSVAKGVSELQTFLALNTLKCPNTKYVLGGYSQGAQVVGQSLGGLSQKARSNVVFVALFGDPKLHLPEGRGILNPPACQGKQFSNWRRDVPDCRTNEGALGARSVYIPADFTNKVGLWCNDSDWVCGSSATPAFMSGHGTYAASKGAIDKSVQEIARRLKSALPHPKNQYIDDRYLLNSDGEARLNVAYIWNVNASSQELYAAAQDSIMMGAEMVWAQGGRVAVTPVVTRGHGESFYHPMGGIDGPFGETRGLIAIGDRRHTEYRTTVYQFNPINPLEKTDLVVPSLLTMDWLPWQQGAEKAMVYLAEDALLDIYGYRYLPSKESYVPYAEYLARRALEIDPVNMYFVIGSDEGLGDAQHLADMTGGKVVQYDPLNPSSLGEALQRVQQEIIDRPIVIFGREAYETTDGNAVVFDVSASYAESGEIVRYDWDYDGDGVWDETTTIPHAAHVYPDGFDGLIHAKATDSSGRVGTMTATVASLPAAAATSEVLPVVQGIDYEILETKDGRSTVRLTWQQVEAAPYVALSVDGIHLGSMTTDRTTVDITDIIRAHDVTIDLQAMNEQQVLGSRRGVTVPALRAPTATAVQGVTSERSIAQLATYAEASGRGAAESVQRRGDERAVKAVSEESAKDDFSVPYILILSGVCAGGVTLFIARKKRLPH